MIVCVPLLSSCATEVQRKDTDKRTGADTSKRRPRRFMFDTNRSTPMTVDAEVSIPTIRRQVIWRQYSIEVSMLQNQNHRPDWHGYTACHRFGRRVVKNPAHTIIRSTHVRITKAPNRIKAWVVKMTFSCFSPC